MDRAFISYVNPRTETQGFISCEKQTSEERCVSETGCQWSDDGKCRRGALEIKKI